MSGSDFWKAYLKDTGRSEERAVFSGELVFEDSGLMGCGQLSLVLAGAKTAVFTPLDSIEINLEKIPVAGEVYVVLDQNNEPRCVIELSDVNVLPLNEISWDLARRDGESENFEEWRDKMRDFLEDEADLCGFEARDDSKIVCEIFRLVYKK